MTLLAFGCSVTHGAEIAALGNSKENIPYSYPSLVAKHLGVDCVNQAFCGNSNENIFHEALDTIPQYKDITMVVVGWTSIEREVWHCDNRIWQFIPRWCATSTGVWDPYIYIVPASGKIPKKCADKEEYLPALDDIYKLLVEYKFDYDVYCKKRDNYVRALRSYCKLKNITLLETCWADNLDGHAVNIGSIGDWFPAMQRHPTAEEHQLFAAKIINYYEL
jgi:hypothetical protein